MGREREVRKAAGNSRTAAIKILECSSTTSNTVFKEQN